MQMCVCASSRRKQRGSHGHFNTAKFQRVSLPIGWICLWEILCRQKGFLLTVISVFRYFVIFLTNLMNLLIHPHIRIWLYIHHMLYASGVRKVIKTTNVEKVTMTTTGIKYCVVKFGEWMEHYTCMFCVFVCVLVSLRVCVSIGAVINLSCAVLNSSCL